MTTQKSIGVLGEKIARNFLIAKSYNILETNWRFKKAEIDIIAQHEDEVVFCEVKTRSYDHFGEPESFVSENKKGLMTDAAIYFMQESKRFEEVRFDIIGIILHNEEEYLINHIENAFFSGIGS